MVTAPLIDLFTVVLCKRGIVRKRRQVRTVVVLLSLPVVRDDATLKVQVFNFRDYFAQ